MIMRMFPGFTLDDVRYMSIVGFEAVSDAAAAEKVADQQTLMMASLTARAEDPSMTLADLSITLKELERGKKLTEAEESDLRLEMKYGKFEEPENISDAYLASLGMGRKANEQEEGSGDT